MKTVQRNGIFWRMILRGFKVLFELWAILFFALGLMAISLIFFQTSNLEAPKEYVQFANQIFEPALNLIRNHYGVFYSEYQGHKYEMTYGVMISILMFLSIACMAGGTLMDRTEGRLAYLLREAQHRYVIWLAKRNAPKETLTSSGQVYVPEAGAILALDLHNLQKFDTLKDVVQKQLNQLGENQRLPSQDKSKQLLRFRNSDQAVSYALSFTQAFKAELANTRFFIEDKPVFRFAVQSLAHENSLFEEENFLWALLSCVGEYDIYLTTAAKEQLEMQLEERAADRSDHNPAFSVMQVGTFAKVGRRTNVNVYRLQLHHDLL